MKPGFAFNIDVVSSCNLRCPSCPQGFVGDSNNNQGLMTPEDLKTILEKAVDECKVESVSLFNWGEPLTPSPTSCTCKNREDLWFALLYQYQSKR